LATVAALLTLASLAAACTTGGSAAVETVVVTSTAGSDVAAGSTPGSSDAGSSDASSGEGSTAGSSDQSTAPTTTTEPAPVATVASNPKFGSKGLSPSAPIAITVEQGTIDDLTMTNPSGKAVDGSLSKDKKTWTLGEVLGYGKKYTVTGTATGTDGKQVQIKGSYTTVTPKKTARTTISPGDGKVVGVAAPVIVGFWTEPQDRAAIEKLVSIKTDPEVEGAWAWVQHDEGYWALDFRPKDYWPSGTKVHVEANVYGFEFQPGVYGAEDLTSDFTIGRNQVVYADVNSHEMVVKRDGEVVATYPASYGRATDENTTTRSGVHVVNEKFDMKKMSNPRYGYVDVLERYAVRISNNGEFIHANPGTVGAQGNTNVSHGCVNLSLENAQAYYDSAIYGDPVEVTGTSVQLGPSDGDIFDWAVPWDTWVTLSGKNS
jgi:lipoprotein-anchoring transpeptidase ErfK/SrfK